MGNKMYYTVEKYDAKTNKLIADYGCGYELQDVKDICKGYTIDFAKGIAFRTNGRFYYFISEDK